MAGVVQADGFAGQPLADRHLELSDRVCVRVEAILLGRRGERPEPRQVAAQKSTTLSSRARAALVSVPGGIGPPNSRLKVSRGDVSG